MTTERVRRRVVVVDDDNVARETISVLLSTLDCEVVAESDPIGFLERAPSLAPDVVVLDVMMPGMSGWEVCRALRDDPEIAGTGVLMLTGIGERLNEMTSPLYGADDHLDKPFDFDELEQRVTALLEKKSAR